MDSDSDEEIIIAVVSFMSVLLTLITGRRREGVGRGHGIVMNPRRNWNEERRGVLRRFYIDNDRMCKENLRMCIVNFNNLCGRLKLLGLSDSRYLTVEEQVAMFLYTVGHDERNRNSVMQFFRSGQTVSHYFHKVLRTVLRLVHETVKPATASNSPTTDCSVQRDWGHYFKDAVGAVDGTHFPTNVPLREQDRYRNRKGVVSQNVLVACTFDMKFTYVLAGWEGSAHDGKLLRDAISRPNHTLTIPQGKYYLADAGFALVPGFLTPYRNTRYHLRDHTNAPQNYKEMFNFRHSSLRTVVERAIGVLKMRFAYLRNRPFHDVKTHSKIIIACCGLHNWLREQNLEEDEFTDDDNVDPSHGETGPAANEDVQNAHIDMATSLEWTAARDALATQIWVER